MQNRIHFIQINSKFGTTSFWIQKQDNGKYHFQMDNCESDLSRKDLKKLAAEIEKCLSE